MTDFRDFIEGLINSDPDLVEAIGLDSADILDAFDDCCGDDAGEYSSGFSDSWEAMVAAPSVGADQDDWTIDATNPIGSTPGYRLTLTANVEVTGIAAPSPTATTTILILNMDNYTLKFKYNDTSSLAANRFRTPENSDFELKQGENCQLTYDTILSRWLVTGMAVKT